MTIRETSGNGFVTQVDVLDQNDQLHMVWTGVDPSLPGTPADFLVEWPRTTFAVKGVKIYVDTDLDLNAWEEIDSVQLRAGVVAPELELLDSSGVVLARGIGGVRHVDAYVADFVAPAADTYFARVTFSQPTNYGLVATRGASFDLEPNNAAESAQDLGVSGQVLGQLADPVVTFDGPEISLPVDLYDSEGFLWDIEENGSISDGSDDSYDGGLEHEGFGWPSVGVVEDGGREVVIGPETVSGVEVVRKIFVPADQAYARFLEIVTNPGSSPVAYTVSIYTDLGSDSRTVLLGSSSGDSSFTPDDDWLVTSDDEDGSNDPPVAHVIAGPGGQRPSSVSAEEDSDEVTYSYELTLGPGETQIVMHFASQNEDHAAALAIAPQLAQLGLDALAGMSSGERAAVVNFVTGGSDIWFGFPEDHYLIHANEGDALEIITTTPGGGAGEPVNDLDPLIELYDANGLQVAANDNDAGDGRNALIAYTVPGGGSGTYRVAVKRATDPAGEYTLAVDGATGALVPFEVRETVPDRDQSVVGYPDSYQLDFSHALLLPTIQASDLTVNGIEADSVTVIDHDTLEFEIGAADVGGGTYTVAVSGGAITSLSGRELAAFSTTFVVDTIPPTVIASSIGEGQVLTVGPVVYQVQFSESLATAGLGPGDVTLTENIWGTSFTPAGFSYDPVTSTATISYNDLSEGSYQLTLVSSAAGFRDLAELLLDGWPSSPLPSGDGNAGGDFVLNFGVDAISSEYPVPLVGKLPTGSLIYDPIVTGLFHGVGDVDAFTLDLDAGQTVTVILTPLDGSIRGRVEWFDPGAVSLGSAATAGPGQPALIQTVSAAEAGVYRVDASCLAGSGRYEVQIIVNAAVEEEGLLGTANDSIATAQNIDAGGVSLQGSADRLAVLGRTEGGDDFYAFSLAAGELAGLVLTAHEWGHVELELQDSSGVVLARGIESANNVDQHIGGFRAPTAGTYYVRVSSQSSLKYSLVTTRAADFGLELGRDVVQDVSLTAAVLGHLVADTREQKLTAADAAGDDRFGYSVSISGETALVGSPYDDDAGAYSGSAYVFRFDGANWVQEQKLTVADATTRDFFGYSVSISGDTALVGARWDDDGGSNSGSAYVFRFDGANWAQEQKLTAPDAAAYDLFGSSVALSGETALVGAYGDDDGGGSSGSAYFFRFDGTNWVQAQKLTASDAALGDNFGRSVAINGDTALVGAIGDDNVGTDSGSAYVFRLEGTNWVEKQKLTASDAADRDNFGWSVALGRDAALVSAYLDDDAGSGSGSAYVYQFPDAVDRYAMKAAAGDTLVITTTTPGDGAGEPVNNLDPSLELYDASGVRVATAENGAGDGRNARIEYTVPVDGTGVYQVAVLAAAGLGDYTLGILGATGASPPLEVVWADPADGVLLAGYPAAYRVDLSQTLLLSSIDAGDLLVNGTPASGVTVVDYDTLEFDVSSADAGDGLYSVTMAAGSLSSLSGTPLEAFSATFDADTTDPTVIASSVGEGQIVATGDLVYQVHFSEGMATAEVGGEDVTLVDNVSGGQFTPDDFSYDPGSNAATLTYLNLREGQYSLTLLTSATAFRDRRGNLLDGSPAFPLPSGDGTPGDEFVVNFTVDNAGEAFPGSLEAVSPLGSLIYDPPLAGFFHLAGDVDTWAIDLDSNQTVTVRLTPQDASILGQVELFDPAGVSLGVAAQSAGETVILQTVPAADAGTYALSLTSLAGTGLYEVELILNAALESEAFGAAANDTIATAQNIDPSAIALHGTADRLAVLGETEGADDYYAFTLEAGEHASLALTPLDGGPIGLALHDASGQLLTLGVEGAANIHQTVSNFSSTTTGTFYARVDGSGGARYSLLVARGATFDLEPNGVASAAQPLGLTGQALGAISPSTGDTVDYFSFDVADGDVLDIRTTTPGGGSGQPPNDFDPRLELYNPLGLLVGIDDNGGDDGRNARITFAAPNNSSGLYTVRLDGQNNGAYILAVSGATAAVNPPPFVTQTTPADGLQLAVGPAALDVVFSEAIRADSLDLPDLNIDGGATVTGVELLDGHTVRFLVTVPDVESTIAYSLAGGAFADLQGLDSIEYQGTFSIDKSGPAVVAQSPALQASAPFGQLTFIFDEAIAALSVGTANVASFTGPGGVDLLDQITGAGVSGAEVSVFFSDQNGQGTYTMVFGLGVEDTAGNLMDQDGNGTGGEPTDSYTATVSLESPDLWVAATGIPASAAFGETIAVSWTVRNLGSDPAAEGWSDRIWLSADVELGAGDILLRTHSASAFVPLAAGADYPQTVSLTLPLETTLFGGNYFILVETDALGSQPESNETNNLGVSEVLPLTLPPLPDLVVSQIEAPVEALAGQQIEISWTVTNQGDGDATGTWNDHVYLSSDAVAGGDQFFGSFTFTGTIRAGQSAVRKQLITLPINVSGDRWAIVQTNADEGLFEHSQANNNTAVDDAAVEISLPNFPNLQVSDVTVPASAFSGQETEISWVVANTGSGDTSALFWYEAVWLSLDDAYDGSDTYLGRVENARFLGAGEDYNNSLTVTLPRGIDGDYYFLVKTDHSNHVYEFEDEGDNIGAGGPTDVQLTPPPDLQVTQVDAPAQAFSGQGTRLSWTVTNQGPGQTRVSDWYDDLYMSEDQILDGNDYYLGRAGHTGALNAGDSYTAATFVTPPSAVSGDFFFFVRTDSGGNVYEHSFETNNDGYDATPTTVHLTPPPDLEVELIDAPATALANHPLPISYRVTNRGASATVSYSWTDVFYLSADTILDPDVDLLLGRRSHSGNLAVDGFYEDTPTFSLPDGLSGSYHAFVVTDVGDTVFELDNNNNLGYDAGATSISSLPPDLVVLADVDPVDPESGQAIVVQWTVTNRGSGDTADIVWRDAIIASGDDTLGNEDDVGLDTFGRSASLDAGQSYLRRELITIPISFQGDYNLFVVTDANDDVYEDAGEDNNSSLALPITVTRSAPDLQVIQVSAEPTAVSGETIRVDWTVQNFGTGPTADSQALNNVGLSGGTVVIVSGPTNVYYWYDDVYLSTDNLLGGDDDIYLGRVTHSGALEPLGQYDASRTFDLPVDLAGDFYLIVQTDGTNRVLEDLLEDNNHRATTTASTIALGPVPDLVVTGVDAPDEGISGQSFPLVWTVRNDGDVTPETYWYDAVYLSRDQIFDREDDDFLGYADQPLGLGPAQSRTLSESFTIPRGLSGSFYVFVATDSGEEVYERDGESNNTGYDGRSMLVSLAPPADLVVGTITVPTNAVPGRLTTIGYTVNNDGTDPALGNWYDSIYISADDQWDLGDPLFGRVRHVGDVLGGTDYSESLAAPLPGVLPGDYHVIIRSDIRNHIPELDETNNIAASLDQAAVDAEELTLGVPDSDVLAQGRSAYYRVDVPAAQTLAVTFDGSPGSVFNELYVSFGQMPTRSQFEFASIEPFSADQRVLVPSTESGTYYILAFGNDVPAAGTYTITAETIPFSVLDMDYGRGGNAGNLTLEINGAQFDRTTVARLTDGAGVDRTAIDHYYVDQTRLFATFDLTGLAPDQYDVVVENGAGESAAVAKGLEVVAGGGSGTNLPQIDAPGAIARNRAFHFAATWNNDGLNDAPIPLLLVGGSKPFGRLTSKSGQ